MNMDELNAPLEVRKSDEVGPLMERRSVAERRIRMQLAAWRDFAAEKWFLYVISRAPELSTAKSLGGFPLLRYGLYNFTS